MGAKAIESRVLRTRRRFMWPDVEWVGWLEPVRVEPTKTEGLATGLLLAVSLITRDASIGWPMAIGNGSHGEILRVALHGGPWDNPGPNNPLTIALPFVTDPDRSQEIQDFLQRTAATAGVSFRRGRRES